jgi:uncharacterized protein (DUF58 family)
MLLVDMSASGLFGTHSQVKREIVAEMAAIMAFSAIQNNDRVGLIIFTDRVEKFVPPKKGKKHVLRVISEILSYRPEHTRTDIACGLDFLGRLAKRRSVAFLFSDFISDPSGRQYPDPRRDALPESLVRALRIAARRHDLIPVPVVDPLEEAFPSMGLVELQDLESGEPFVFDSSGPEATAHRVYTSRAREARQALFRRLKLDYINVRTDVPYLAALVAFFKARERRLRH